MAKGIYVGVDGVAKKVKKAYVSAGGIAKKVKKAYVGVGGVARLCFSETKTGEYYGTLSNLSHLAYANAAASIGNYALFAGGGYSKLVDTYDVTLAKGTATDMYTERNSHAATSIGDYALIAGGRNYSSSQSDGKYTSKVDAYTSSLVHTTTRSLSGCKYDVTATSIDKYAFFPHGEEYKDSSYQACTYIDTFSETLLRQSISVSSDRYNTNVTSANVGGYALFAGGLYNNTPSTRVLKVDDTLTLSLGSAMSAGRYLMAAASTGDYALFAGGKTSKSSDYSNIIDVYDKTLVRLTPLALSEARSNLAATVVDGCAIFAGGKNASGYSKTVDMVDSSLTVSTLPSLSKACCDLAATSIGGYAIFGGGEYRTSNGTNVVSAYTVI